MSVCPELYVSHTQHYNMWGSLVLLERKRNTFVSEGQRLCISAPTGHLHDAMPQKHFHLEDEVTASS